MLDQPPFAQKPMAAATQTAAAGPEAAQPGMEEDIDAIEEVEATPEEQKQYDMLMKHAYSIMADEKAFPKLEAQIEDDPHNAIADSTITILAKLEKDKGEQDTDTLQALAAEIIPNLAELAEAHGIDIPEDELEQVLTLTIAKWSEANPDRVDVQGMSGIGGAALETLQSQQNAQPAGGENVQLG